jgi:hypothetical protein
MSERSDDAAAIASLNVEFLDRLFLLMRQVAVFGANHPTANDAAESLQEAIDRAGPPFVLQFVRGAVFRDRVLVPLDADRFQQAANLERALSNLATHEVCVDEVPPLDAVSAFGIALARGAQGPSPALQTAKWRGLRFRELPYAQYGEEAEEVDPGVFTAAQIALAIGEAERARKDAEEYWPWAHGVSIVRRLERAIETDRDATDRAMELAPGAWTPPRRAVSAALTVMGLLTTLDLTRFARRAAAHATLALATLGYRDRDGLPLAEAAQATLTALLAAPITAHSGVDPHRLRVCTCLNALCERGSGGAELSLNGLLVLAYEIERKRCPEGVSFNLTRVDLMAEVVREMGQSLDATWVRALVGASGAVPVGAYVLADGRLGVVIESAPADDPWRPRVLVGGEVVTPREPVVLHSPLTRH